MVRKGCSMLKGLLVISSLIFCVGALFAPPPTAQDVARWKGVVLQGAYHLGRSALSAVVSALPSAGEVAHYIGQTGLLPEGVAVNVLGNFLESEAPASAEPEAPVATPECRPGELDELLPRNQHSTAWISHEDIACPPEAELPRPFCDPRVQAVLRLLEEDRVRRGESLPLCGEAQPAPPASRE
jgi:hypothetical protein